MIAPQNRREMATELSDLAIADIGVEHFLQHCHLLRADELLVIEEAPVSDYGVLNHVLDLVDDLGAYVGWFHWKTTSRCVHWKRTLIKLVVFSVTVVCEWNFFRRLWEVFSWAGGMEERSSRPLASFHSLFLAAAVTTQRW
jgi:hypothetical protein